MEHPSLGWLTADSLSRDPPVFDLNEAEEERQHLQKIIAALKHYRKYSLIRVNKTERYLNSLTQHHQNMLMKYRHHLNVVRDCIDKNQIVIKMMLNHNVLEEETEDEALHHHQNQQYPKKQQHNLNGHNHHNLPIDCTGNGGSILDVNGDKTFHRSLKIRPQDMEHLNEDGQIEGFKILKVQSTLKAIARDWSFECAAEREQSYKRIIDAIESYYNPNDYNDNDIKILVPGCGLGRLTYELACRGYECEGNEFSYFMLIASNFVLNTCTEANMYTLYPWVHQYVNNLKRADQVAAVRFPDVCPAKNKPRGMLSVIAGDFLEVYKRSNCYDCVATCFFIDCANNIVDFVETIYRILVPGGIWVNLGPLLYHFSDIPNEDSIEPTYEDLMPIIEEVGFEVLSSETGIRTKYAQNPQSMLKSEYESLFWICRKPIDDKKNNDDHEDPNFHNHGLTSNNIVASSGRGGEIINNNQYLNDNEDTEMVTEKNTFSSTK